MPLQEPLCRLSRAIQRDISLTNPAISFPYRADTISISTVFLAAVVGPALIVFSVSIFFIRILTNDGSPVAKSRLWRRKLWEWHTGWLGLALAIVASFFFTQTMKNLFGKPRPDFLARCNPDLSKYSEYVVGGFTGENLEDTSVLVSWGICRSKDGSGVGLSEFNDGFRSFPSGHCTSKLRHLSIRCSPL
jgi:membrane-associated phospholipid phosphatase